jgi:hypothetical protein
MDSLYLGITNIGSCGDTDKPETGADLASRLANIAACPLAPNLQKKKKSFRLHASLRTLSLRRKMVPN